MDNNKIVILKSTGTFNGASRTITAVVQRGNLPINAAVSLPGVQGDTYSNTPPCAISVGCYYRRRPRLPGRRYVGPVDQSHRSRRAEVRDDGGQ